MYKGSATTIIDAHTTHNKNFIETENEAPGAVYPILAFFIRVFCTLIVITFAPIGIKIDNMDYLQMNLKETRTRDNKQVDGNNVDQCLLLVTCTSVNF